MILAAAIGVGAIIFGAWAFLLHITHKHASEQEQIARAQRYYKEAARKVFEEKQGRRDAA